MLSTIKTSVSLHKDLWTRLKCCRNKSGIMNEALSLYFSREENLKNAENEYWEKVENSIASGNKEYMSLNEDGGEINADTLENILWK